ncbi:MAG: hypothetical protein RLZZ400_485 [Actinomycetota bacterium]
MKRIIWSIVIGLFALLPSLVPANPKLPSDLRLNALVNTIGDVEFVWSSAALSNRNYESFSIGYEYEDKGKTLSFKPIKVDGSLGSAAFRNLSLGETYNFNLRLVTGDGTEYTEALKLTTPPAAAEEPADHNVRAQMLYVNARWQTTSNSNYMYIESNDCANFASQTLVARGLKPDSRWNQVNFIPTRAWVSATALNEYLRTLPGVRQLSNGQRDRVKIGDLVFFDWDRSGDRDHVGIVSHIQQQVDGTYRIYYAGHTSHTLYRSVDWAITVVHPNANVYFLSIPRTPSASLLDEMATAAGD